jgi:hypothetical protein
MNAPTPAPVSDARPHFIDNCDDDTLDAALRAYSRELREE